MAATLVAVGLLLSTFLTAGASAGTTTATSATASTTAEGAASSGLSGAFAANWIAGELSSTSTPGLLADGVIALAAAGHRRSAGEDAFVELVDAAPGYATTAANASKLVLAASAAGADPADLDGFDAEAALRSFLVTEGEHAGRFGSTTQLFVQSFAILALSTTEDGVPASAVDYLVGHACADGTFNFPGTCPAGDVDVTAIAAQALLAAGEDVDTQIDWLLDAQAGDGSFASAAGLANTNSTALAAQVLRATGHVAEADAAAAFVGSLQKPVCPPTATSGAVATYPDADADLWLATTQAVFAVSPTLDQLDLSAARDAAVMVDCIGSQPCSTVGVTVVVDFTTLDPDRESEVTCVPYQVGGSGHDHLEAAAAVLGLDIGYVSFSFGDALCQVDGLPVLSDGDPTETCFETGFWSYWTATAGGAWEGYEVGGDDSRPAPGSVEGWSWAPGFVGEAPRLDPTLYPVPEPYARGIEEACPGTYPASFGDVGSGNVHGGPVRCLAAAGIVQGTAAGRFEPTRPVTRAQAATFLARAAEYAFGESLPAGEPVFSDVAGNVHADNIHALAALGVVRGVGDGTTYAPQATLNRGQMATLLARFLDLLDDGELNGSFPPGTSVAMFPDVTAEGPERVHADAIARLAVQGVVQGRTDGTYGPAAPVLRDQLATFLARALDLAATGDYAPPVD